MGLASLPNGNDLLASKLRRTPEPVGLFSARTVSQNIEPDSESRPSRLTILQLTAYVSSLTGHDIGILNKIRWFAERYYQFEPYCYAIRQKTQH
jgi:hypothetical protein